MKPINLDEQLTTDRIHKVFPGLNNRGGTYYLIYSEEDATVACSCNSNMRNDPRLVGKSYRFFTECKTCNGTGEIIREANKRYPNPGVKKCPDCDGDGFFKTDEPIITGVCKQCNGKLKHNDVSIHDKVTKNDLETLSNIIVFTTKRDKSFTFDDAFIGVNAVAGSTTEELHVSYKSYRLLEASIIKQKVMDNFLNSTCYYRQFLNRQHEVCHQLIIIAAQGKGWRLIPLWEGSKKHLTQWEKRT